MSTFIITWMVLVLIGGIVGIGVAFEATDDGRVKAFLGTLALVFLILQVAAIGSISQLT